MPDSTDGTPLPAAFPEGWRTKTLAEIASIHGGGTPSRQVPAYWGGTIPWVTPGEVTGHPTKYLTKTQDRITKAGLASSSATLLPVDSLLLTTRASLGAAVLSGVPIATNQGFQSLVFGTSTNPHFFYHLVPRLEAELTRRASGTTFLEISGRELAKVEVPLPALSEQRRIAEILDTVDEAIQRTEELISKLEEMKKGLLHDLLTCGIDENGELRDPERHPEQFKDSPLGRIPSEWDCHRLGELASLQGGFAFPSDIFGSGPVPVVRMSDLRGERLDTSNAARISATYLRTHASVALREGDLVIGMSGSLDNLAVVGGHDLPALLNQRVGRFIIENQGALKYRMLDLFVSSEFYQRQLRQEAAGAAQLNISSQQVEDTVVPKPPLAEQERLLCHWEALKSRIRTETTQLEKIRSLKQALMNDLLTGQVRVNVPEPEEATA